MIPSLAGLAKLGVFVEPAFLDKTLCATLCEAIKSADSSLAEMYDGEQLTVAQDMRRARQTLLVGVLRDSVQQRINALIPAVSAHFAMPLTKTEGASFLMYEAGGFFRPHRDRAVRETERRVSAVVFLNEQAGSPGPTQYAGGRLTLYGLMPNSPEVGFPVDPHPGLLVAFDATTLHEVTPVRQGCRITAVDWFF
jgi:predicted 2-oxoglutarate/Fe(II)-dependent dioxygenase YbiX